MSARLAGLIVALLVGAALIAIAVASRGPAPIVVPTNGVTAGGKADNPAGVPAQAELTARTDMQRWPGETAHPPPGVRALGSPASSPPVGEQRVREWWADKRANQDILDQSRFREGLASLPEPERGVLVQPQGRTWRHLHTYTLAYGGAPYVVAVSLLIAVFLAGRGRISLAAGESSENVKRVSALGRAEDRRSG